MKKNNIKAKNGGSKVKKTNRRSKAAAKNITEEISENVTKERTSKRSLVKFVERPKTLTGEAYRWYMDLKAIPGAGSAPYRFAGWRIIDDLFELLERPLGLSEVQKIVELDGKKATCAVDKVEFQPVRYARFFSREAAEQIKKTKSLDGIEFVYGGVYFSHAKVQDGQRLAFSGCIFNSRGSWAKGSPLFMAMKGFSDRIYGKKKKGFVWGESVVTMEQNHKAHLEWKERRRMQGVSDYRRRQDTMDSILGFEPKHRKIDGPAAVLHQRDERVPERLASPFQALELPPKAQPPHEATEVTEVHEVAEVGAPPSTNGSESPA